MRYLNALRSTRKPALVLTNIDKDVLTVDGHRVKLTRITSLRDLKAGTRYFRFGVGGVGNIIHSEFTIIGREYGVKSPYLNQGRKCFKIKVRDSYRNQSYEREYYVSDLGLGNRGDSIGVYVFNAKTERVLNYLYENRKVEAALLLTRGFNFDVQDEVEEMRLADKADREMQDSYFMLDDDR